MTVNTTKVAQRRDVHYDSYDELRSQTMAYLDTLTDEDLDLPSKGCPPGMEQYFGTIGKCLIMCGLHSMTHRGQVADSRRAAGHKPAMI
jgi:hypothetical protein